MEREVIRQLFVQHYARMQRVARSLLYDEQECEDVIGDIFESLLSGQTTIQTCRRIRRHTDMLADERIRRQQVDK